MSTRKATQADKAAVRRLLGHDPDPEADLQRMIRELIREGAKRGIQVKVDLRKDVGDDPWIAADDLQLQSGLLAVAARLRRVGIEPTAAIVHPSAFNRNVDGTFIDADGKERAFMGKTIPKVRVGTKIMTRSGGVWQDD